MNVMKHARSSLSLLAVVFLTLAMVLAGLPPRTSFSAPPQPTSAIPISEVPIDIYRRAAEFLEEMRGEPNMPNPMAPEWSDERGVQFDEVVTPLYRPDVVDPDTGEEIVAYYEFKVIDNQTEPAGFIVLSTGDHDFPIAHWDYTGYAPTWEMDVPRTNAGPQQNQSYKFYKLDTLFYAAQGEDENGDPTLDDYVGTPLVKVEGMQEEWLEEDQEESEEEWIPPEEQEKDSSDQNTGQKWQKTSEGPTGNDELKLVEWGDLENNPDEWWKSLKEGYTESYGVLLKDLERIAEEDWEVEKQARQIGEVLVKGDVYIWPLLYNASESDVSVSGDGEQYVEIEFLERPGLLPAVQITVTDDPPQNAMLEITVNYPSTSANLAPAADSETGSFVIATTEPLEISFLPMIITSGSSTAAAPAPTSDIETQDDWGPWTYYWAGNEGDQRYYRQLAANSEFNNRSCASGCGGTAWAMLFGWADKQADDGNAYWAPRWGLYREGGGTGADDVAPRFMTNGVRSITREIRIYIDTWCAFGSGATFPWDMDEAREYFINRTGTRLKTNYNVLGIHTSGLRERARNSIRDRDTPAIIGTGWLNHYPMAWGYAWRSRRTQACFICPWKKTEYSRFFYVNQGWGGSGDGWVSAGTWFAGRIYPN